MSRLFSDTHITQEYLRRYPNSKRSKSWAGKMVHIQTENGVWRTGGSGYTYAGRDDAWVLPFEDAVRQISHCGPEKCGRFLLVCEKKGDWWVDELRDIWNAKFPVPLDTRRAALIALQMLGYERKVE